MGEDEYEELPEGTSVRVTMMAGALAGVMEHCVMYPVDCVKTRMQSLACDTQMVAAQRQGIVSSLITIMKEEGRFRPVQGVQAMALGAGPAHALYFATYEKMKETLLSKKYPDSVSYLLAGASATVFHDAIMTPSEVVKQRMQMCCSPYKSCLNCFTTVLRQEGFGAFYRSYVTGLTMNIPFQGTQFMIYEAVQKITNPKKEHKPLSHIISGGLAGAIASIVTMPWDVCKTLLNTQEAQVLKKLNTEKVTGMYHAWRTVYQMAGWRGYFKGVKARVMYQFPATAISWTVYEGFKHFLSKSKEDRVIDKYDTINDLRLNVNASGADLSARAVPAAKDKDDVKEDNKLMDMITDLPRKVRGEMVDLCQTNNSELIEIDTRTFPPRFRTD